MATSDEESTGSFASGRGSAFRAGLGTNLLNPKAGRSHLTRHPTTPQKRRRRPGHRHEVSAAPILLTGHTVRPAHPPPPGAATTGSAASVLAVRTKSRKGT